MPKQHNTSLTLVALAFAVLAFACGDDDSGLGATCNDDGDCDGICATGREFPGGICTYLCYDNRDCPNHWVCTDKQGGTCLETCSSSDMCKDLYDNAWHCKSVSLQPSGKAAVCVGD